MPPKAHDKSAHQTLLKTGGSFSRSESIDGQTAYITRLTSYRLGSGFGTAAVREVFDSAMKKKQQLVIDASWSSHIFWLYMGMLPVDRPIGYVKHYYGIIGQWSLEKLKNCTSVEALTQEKASYLESLIFMLRRAGNLPKTQELNAQDVIDNRELLLSLRGRKLSYLSHEFIPSFLDILKASIGDKYPDTSLLTSVVMQLSEKGKEHWQEAIKEEVEFVPFKAFEQLVPFMTTSQKGKLDFILLHRPLALQIMAIDIDFTDKRSVERVKAHRKTLLDQAKIVAESGIKGLDKEFIKKILIKKENAIEAAAQKQIESITKTKKEEEKAKKTSFGQPDSFFKSTTTATTMTTTTTSTMTTTTTTFS